MKAKILVAVSLAALLMGADYAHAASFTQTVSQDLAITDWKKAFTINQFNSAWGELERVNLSFGAGSEISINLVNTGAIDATKVKATSESGLILKLNDEQVAAVDASYTLRASSVSANGGRMYSGVQKTTATPFSAEYKTSTELAKWIGTGTLAGLFSTDTGFGLGGLNTANLNAQLTSYSWGKLSVTYNYQPIESPIPAAVWLFGSGVAGLAGLAKRKKASLAA